jgi:hypothetical protein
LDQLPVACWKPALQETLGNGENSCLSLKNRNNVWIAEMCEYQSKNKKKKGEAMDLEISLIKEDLIQKQQCKM